MSRILIERLQLWALLVVTAVLSCALPARAQTPSERAEARAAFDRGVALAKASDYEAALREFARAYAVVPHYSVLYNVGQAELALGRRADAARSFRRYLDEGGSGVEQRRRAELEAQLTRLEPASSAGPAADPAPPATPAAAAAAPAALTAPPAPVAPVASVSAPASPDRISPSGVLAPSAASQRETAPAHGSARRTAAYVLGGASVALAGAALGHYLWNRDRYQEWQTERRAYEGQPTEYQRSATNDLARSISRASVVTVALCIGASAALGTSVVLFVSSSATPTRRGDRLDGVVGVRGTF